MIALSTGEIIALCALGVSALVMLLGGRRDTRASAADQAQVQAKLDSIAGGVDDIRVEQRAMRDRVDAMGQRLSTVEASAKSAHHRLDSLEERFMAAHPPD